MGMGRAGTMGRQPKDILSGESVRDKSNQEVNPIQDILSKYYPDFILHNDEEENIPHGIRLIEGFIFYALCRHFKVNLIIESGIRNGKSTAIWGRCWTNIPIVSIDCMLNPATASGLSVYQNITLLRADSLRLLPYLVEQNADKRCGVFIDGPKGSLALRLAAQCLSHDNVCVVGVHDVKNRGYETAETLFNLLNASKFTADDPLIYKHWMKRFYKDVPEIINSAVYAFKDWDHAE